VSVSVILRYEDTSEDRFDRDYYLNKHLPWAQKEWELYGLLGIRAFFPVERVEKKGSVCVFECIFKDREALEKAFAATCTAKLLADIPAYTDMQMIPGILGPFDV